MSSSSDDDGPLLARRSAHAHREAVADRSDSDSPLPDWLSQNASPSQPLELLSDSDEEADGAKGGQAGPSSQEAEPKAVQDGAAGAALNGQAQRGRGKRKVHGSVLQCSDDDDAGQEQQAAKRQKLAKTAAPAEPAAKQAAGKGKKPLQGDLHGWLQSQTASAPAAEASVGLAAPLDSQQVASKGEEGTQAQPGPSSQLKEKKAAAGKAAMLAAVPGEIPIMLPDKLPANKFLVELETGNDSSTDLAGDAGVVGRWLVQQRGEGGGEALQLDLKGVLYQASVVPCASTLCVVNIGTSEAKVELLSAEFVSLRREAGAGGLGDNEGGADHFMFDDDDNYQLPGGGTQQRGDEDEAGPKKKRGKAAGAAGSKKPAAKRSSGAKPGGAKKRPAKPGGKAKSSKK